MTTTPTDKPHEAAMQELKPCPFCGSPIEESINALWKPPLRLLRTTCNPFCPMEGYVEEDTPEERNKLNARANTGDGNG